MTEKIKNLICSVSFLLIGVFIYVEASQIKVIMAKDLGSGFFPKVVGVAMILMALLELVLTLVENRKDSTETAKPDNTADEDKKGMFLTILCMIGYAVLFEPLGFIISSTLYLFLQITILSNRKNRKLSLFAIISIVTSVVVYVIFVYLIGMPLPMGLIEF